jgi:O-antigen ligase
VLLCLVLEWALFRFGAAETDVLLGLFLLLIPAAGLALVSFRALPFGDWRDVPLVVTGVVMLVLAAALPSLESRGFVHAAVGWIALVVTLEVAGRGPRSARGFVWFLSGVGWFEAGYGFVQAIGGVDYIGTHFRELGPIATGTLIHYNHYAGLLNMVFALAVGVALGGRSSSRRRLAVRGETVARTWLLILGCASMGLAVLLSRSRGGAVTLVATAVFLAAMLAARGFRDRQMRGAARAGSILILTVAGLGLAFGVDKLLARFENVDENARIVIYGDTLRMIADHPLGIGPGMYQWRILQYETLGSTQHYGHAHNDYLEIAAEWGVAVAILFWAMVVWRFVRSASAFFHASDPWLRGLGLGTAGAILSILIHSLVDFNLQIPSNLMVFAIVLGLSWVASAGIGAVRREATVHAIGSRA